MASMTIFWVVSPCSLVDVCPADGDRKPSETLTTSTKLRFATTWKKVIFMSQGRCFHLIHFHESFQPKCVYPSCLFVVVLYIFYISEV